MFHCEQYTEYAIESLESSFTDAALLAGFESDYILYSYSKVLETSPKVFEIGYYTRQDAEKLREVYRKYPIGTILAFDLPYPTAVCKSASCLGVDNIISYWGASMSTTNHGLKLLVKRAEWWFRGGSAPTKFIFESQAMKRSATHGRGISSKNTTVIPLGVDVEKYYPAKDSHYAHNEFKIPFERKIIFYSGHMEERKGVRILIEAIKILGELGKIEPFHLLICGNKERQSKRYEELLTGSIAKKYVTFAGYRKDIPEIMQSAFLGAIASTGWDSFTMSSIEMLASGLPLIVSDLDGLRETIEPELCGELIEPGDSMGLATRILEYFEKPNKHKSHSKFARQRAVDLFSKSLQIRRISELIASTR